MASKKKILVRLLGVGVVLAGLLVGGPALARLHVHTVTGNPNLQEYYCLNCHGSGWNVRYAVGAAHPDPWDLAVSSDGRTLFVACGPTKSIAIIDLEARKLRRSVPTDGFPRGVALSPDGSTLAVSLGGTDQVALLELPSLKVRQSIPVGLDPAGLEFSGSGKNLIVANAYSGNASVIDVESGQELYRVATGREPYTTALSPDGRTVAVVSRMVNITEAQDVPRSEVTLIDAEQGRVTSRVELLSCHLSEGAAFTPDGRYLLVTTIRVRNLLPIMQVARGWVMSSVLAVIDLENQSVSLAPLQEVNDGFADPSGIAVTPDGQRAFVAAGGVDQVGILDLPTLLQRVESGDASPDHPEHLAWTHTYLEARIPMGDNPRGVLLTGTGPDGLVVVAERLDDTVALLDRDGNLQERIRVGLPIPEDAVRRGERVFHDATFAFQSSFSCRSCHPGRHTDGLTYDFDIDGVGKNVLLNRSLRGVAGTAPFKWSGLNPTLARQCGARFAMVLTRADPFPEPMLQDLVAFLQSSPPPGPAEQPGQVGTLRTGAVARGEKLYFRTHRKDGSEIPPNGQCVTCHPPPHFTNRLKADVGTRNPRDSSGEFDVPHLTGIGSKAPYLHDGRATTLEEIWTLPGVFDNHGVVTDLTKTDLNDLVEYLRSL